MRLLDKEICWKCCKACVERKKEPCHKNITAIRDMFDGRWNSGYLKCELRDKYLEVMDETEKLNGSTPWNQKLIEECPYLLEHTVELAKNK